MYRRRKRDTAIPDTLNLEGLRRRMVNFKDFEGFGKGWPAERKAVEAGTYQDILAGTFARGFPERILRIARSNDNARVGDIGQEEIVEYRAGRLQGYGLGL
jgi:hypothetical protein